MALWINTLSKNILKKKKKEKMDLGFYVKYKYFICLLTEAIPHALRDTHSLFTSIHQSQSIFS